MNKHNNLGEANKGIILIIVLWVLFFLSIVVLTLGFKNRINIRLRSFNNEQLRAFYLAKEGVNRAIVKLVQDDTEFDSLNEDWSKGFILEKDYGKLEVKVIDEDRFLNINLLSKEYLVNMTKIVESLQKDDLEIIYSKRPFNVAKELKYINLFDEDKFDIISNGSKVKLYDLLTTFSDGRININTVSEEVLLMIPGMNKNIVESIIQKRENAPFEDMDTLSGELSDLGLTPGQIGSLIKIAKTGSSVFRIKSKAVSSGRAIEKILEVVIKKEKDSIKVLYAGEN